MLVANHQSFLDGCFLAAFLPGSPMFAVDVNTSQQWWARPFLAAIRHFDVDPANAVQHQDHGAARCRTASGW